MSREQEHDRIKQLETVQDRIVEGKLLSVEDRIACYWGMQCRINSYKEHLYGMEYFWDHGTYAPATEGKTPAQRVTGKRVIMNSKQFNFEFDVRIP